VGAIAIDTAERKTIARITKIEIQAEVGEPARRILLQLQLVQLQKAVRENLIIEGILAGFVGESVCYTVCGAASRVIFSK